MAHHRRAALLPQGSLDNVFGMLVASFIPISISRSSTCVTLHGASSPCSPSTSRSLFADKVVLTAVSIPNVVQLQASHFSRLRLDQYKVRTPSVPLSHLLIWLPVCLLSPLNLIILVSNGPDPKLKPSPCTRRHARNGSTSTSIVRWSPPRELSKHSASRVLEMFFSLGLVQLLLSFTAESKPIRLVDAIAGKGKA